MTTIDVLLVKSYRLFLFDELEEYESAIDMLTRYLETDPQNGIAYNNRGLAYSEIGQGDEALLDFAKAMECSPDDPIPYINRGDLYLRATPTGRFDEAIDDFTRAITVDGNNATFHRCRAYACIQANRLDEAIDSFSEAIRLNPQFRQTYIDRGKTYQRLGEDQRAEHDFQHAKQIASE